MLWFTLWFLVILKLPALYLAWVIWWAVKDPPGPQGGGGLVEPERGADGGPGRHRTARRRLPRPRRGPHGGPVRRPVRPRVASGESARR